MEETYSGETGETIAGISAGQRLRDAREAQGRTLDDIAAATRIPVRHLEAIETSDWDRLPASTYAMGFAKNYAAAVGLDRQEIGEQMRLEISGRPAPAYTPTEYVEPVDPRRAIPGWLVWGGLLGAALVAGLLFFLNQRANSPTPAPVIEAPVDGAGSGVVAPSVNAVAAAPATPAAGAPVRVTAKDAVWVDIRDGETRIKFGEMKAGESVDIPATAAAPVITTGRPEALTISADGREAPPIGPAGKRVKGVSLKSDALFGPGSAAVAPPPAVPATPPANAAPTRP